MLVQRFWHILLRDAYKTGQVTQELKAEEGLRMLRDLLFAWYRWKRQALSEGEHIYELQDLIMKMIGSPLEQCLATKAAEAGTLIEFMRDELQAFFGSLDEQGMAWLGVGKALVSFRDEMRQGERTLDTMELQRLADLAARAFSLRPLAGIAWLPK